MGSHASCVGIISLCKPILDQRPVKRQTGALHIRDIDSEVTNLNLPATLFCVVANQLYIQGRTQLNITETVK